MEAVVVGVGHLLPVGVESVEGGLEPAGHGVGQVRDQLARALTRDDQPLPLRRLEAVAVHVAGR